MTIIEGIGDEVTHFFFGVLAIIVTLIAWRSTHIIEQPFIRTVLIVQRRRRRFQRRLESHRELLEAANITSHLQDAVDNENQQSLEVPCATCSKASVSDGETTENLPAGPRVVDVDDETLPAHDVAYVGTYVERMSGETFTTRLVRSPNMIFTHGHGEEDATSDEAPFVEPLSSEAQPLENERDLATGTDADGPVQEAESGDFEDSSSELGNIRIRLKYLNDDQKLVEGRLAEPLGDFKRRHFGLELAADKLVRLVYNGQVLNSDSQTLQGYGLFDNCVVHCLVHQQRTPAPTAASAPDGARSPREADGHRDWDLGHLLFFSLSLVLSLAWYCRYQYAQLFSATTTVALVGLSGILAVSLVGNYLPDQDGIRHHAAT